MEVTYRASDMRCEHFYLQLEKHTNFAHTLHATWFHGGTYNHTNRPYRRFSGDILDSKKKEKIARNSKQKMIEIAI